MDNYIKLIIAAVIVFLIWKYGPSFTASVYSQEIKTAFLQKLASTKYTNDIFSVVWQNNSTLMNRNHLESSLILTSPSGIYLYFNFILGNTSYLSEISEERARVLMNLTPSGIVKKPYEIRHENA